MSTIDTSKFVCGQDGVTSSSKKVSTSCDQNNDSASCDNGKNKGGSSSTDKISDRRTNNIDEDTIDDNSEFEEEDSDDEEDDYGTILDDKTYQRLKQDDPAVTRLCVALDCIEGSFFSSINWKVDGDCITNNTHLKSVCITHSNRGQSFNYRNYVLGEEGHNLPTRQQLQDFFSCIQQNSSIHTLIITSIDINDEFDGGLMKGLDGHQSLVTLQISHGRLGSVGCQALGKVLKHSESKVKHLILWCARLDDFALDMLCNELLNNNTIKSLSLNNNESVTPSGWQALYNVIQHPNCNLTKLCLHNNDLDDDAIFVLGSALSGLSSIKALNLASNELISNAGWKTFLNQLAHTSIESLNLGRNDISDSGLATLAHIGTLKSLDLSGNVLITPTGWRSFFISLKSMGTRLVKLDISNSKISNAAVAALGNLVSNMTTLKTLNMIRISHTDDNSVNGISSQGWVSLFTSLQGANLDLTKLSLCNNSIDDDGLQLLVRLVSSMSSLTHLDLHDNGEVTPSGWQALTGYLRSPNFALEELHLYSNNVNDDTVIRLVELLTHNKTLKRLDLDYCTDDDDNDLITERGWEAVSTLLCNKRSIMDTYNSNHTLQYIHEYYCYDDLNGNKDKVEVARQKIMQTHFTNADDTTGMQELLDMELEVIPTAISWVGRPTPIDWSGICVSGLSLLYNLMRGRVSELFDSNIRRSHLQQKMSSRCR